MQRVAYIYLPSGRLPVLLRNYTDPCDGASLDWYAGVCQQIMDKAPYLEVWQ
ncbi:MAG: hypothetical protein ACYC6A_21595 [Armatimonadota bacterium]